MPGKYIVKKEDVRHLYGIIDMEMSGSWHDFYKDFGLVQDGSNFICVNKEAHGAGTDSKPSMGISDDNGMFQCFTCGIKGNASTFYKDFVSGTQYDSNDGSFTSYMIDRLNIKQFINIDGKADPEHAKNLMQMRELYNKLNGVHEKERGKPHIMSNASREEAKKEMTLDMGINDKYVENLLASSQKMEFLEKTRNINADIVHKYRLGLNERGKITFPVIDANGTLLNVKAYDPWGPPIYKWTYPFKGYPVKPTPINNFTGNKIVFFEGEPDTFCAIGFGINGAVTMGSKANTDVVKTFGEDTAKQLFTGKEIIICLDTDAPGRDAAQKLAKSLHPYVKQIKVLDLDKSDINPYGLDPEKVRTIDGKVKRVETDFTDFMKLNGFNDNARLIFNDLINRTSAYTEDTNRKKKKIFKVTLQEARMSKYYSADNSIELELTASVSDMNFDSFKFAETFDVSCRAMSNTERMSGACRNCNISGMDGFGAVDKMTFKIAREQDRTNKEDKFTIITTEHNILGLIEVKDSQKQMQQKKLAKINDKCRDVTITDMKNNGLIYLNLVKDVAEQIGDNTLDEVGSAEIGMNAYLLESGIEKRGCKDIYPNKSYKFKATQTTAWNGQYAVLFIHDAQPLSTSIETFKMNEETHDILQIFKPKEKETIEEHLKRRYTIFSNASGINNREDLFFINDLSYFSAIEIDNKKILPAVKRGWVEVLIAGDPRCGKTIISKFLHRHYKIGEIIGGSSAISRTGLVAAISYFKNRSTIKWGKMPMNDGGLVIIDEMSTLDEKTLDDLTSLRSEGIAEIEKAKSGKVTARVRKIMLSNERSWRSEDSKDYTCGIEMLKDLCFKDPVLARFDVGYVVKAGDVKVEDFTAIYDQISTDFTEYQCQSLIKWAYSRSSKDIIFEDGFEKEINESQNKMLKTFHPATQLVNQEMRAKLVRLSISLATILYSTPDEDWNKILVKKDHVNYIRRFLTKIYCGENIRMDLFSDIRRKTEELGDMHFMMNILKYVDINLLMRYEEFSDKDIGAVFNDYLSKVQNRQLYMVDGMSDDVSMLGLRSMEGQGKLIGILLTRNCISKTRYNKYKKSEKFNKWLVKRLEAGNAAEQSSILEHIQNKSTAKVDEKIRELDKNYGRAKG